MMVILRSKSLVLSSFQCKTWMNSTGTTNRNLNNKCIRLKVFNSSQPISDLAEFHRGRHTFRSPSVLFHVPELQIPMALPRFSGAERCRAKTGIEKTDMCWRTQPPAFNVNSCTHQCDTQTQLCTLAL